MKKTLLLIASTTFLVSCDTISSSSTTNEGEGQVIYHWERENTGIEKFSRDHNECMHWAEDFRLMPNMKSWFYSEKERLNIVVDWHAEKGVWASYIPYSGAQPVVVGSLWRNQNISPSKYRRCMEDRGYWHRTYNIPTTSNLFVYDPQTIPKDMPGDGAGY